MTVHRTIAVALAGSFFMLVSALFTGLVLFGWSAANSRDDARRIQRYEAPAEAAVEAVVVRPPMPFVDRGQLFAWDGTVWTAMPDLETDYDVDVRGDLVTVRLTQRFENVGEVPVDATYQFPLEENAAVYGMTMRVGEEVVEAKIRKREEAKQEFEAAQAAGQAAALTEQQRPNLFRQSVANLMPGEEIEIELRYTHALKREEGEYVLTLPLAVGDKFTPAAAEVSAVQSALASPPRGDTEDRVSIDVRLDAGLPIQRLHSMTHELDITKIGATDARIQLADRRVANDRDFELRFAIAGDEPAAGLLATFDEETGRGYFSLLIEPPRDVDEAEVQKREMVFVLDCSGSMSGPPMAASKAFMRQALRKLRPTDTFRVIRFSDDATEYSTKPIRATADNIADALAYVAKLDGGGGTVMTAGVQQALAPPVAEGTIRLVTFMTDGYIGNDLEVTQMLREEVGDARLFAIGVGTSTNRYLLEEMGRAGRGFTRYVDPTEDPETTASEIAGRLQSPVMTDVQLLSEKGVELHFDGQIEDLFDRGSVRVSGTYEEPGVAVLKVRGQTARGPIELPIEVSLPGEALDGDAVRLMWARDRIADQMHLYATPHGLRELNETNATIEATVTDLGLRHSLMTQWTSFVAVSTKLVNSPASKDKQPVEIPSAPVAGTMTKFSGGTTPEPGIIGGLVLMLVGGAASRRRKHA